MYPACLARVSRYLAARRYALEPEPLAAYLDRHGIPADLRVAEHDLAGVLARTLPHARSLCLPRSPHPSPRSGGGQQQRTAADGARPAPLPASGPLGGACAWPGRALDEEGNGCLLALLAALVGLGDWTSLRTSPRQPLLIEVLVRAVRPGETPATNAVLGVLALWLADDGAPGAECAPKAA